MSIAFDNSYARLPERFYALTPPSPVAQPKLLRLNEALANELGLDAAWLDSPEGVEMLAGNRVPTGSTPIAQAYAGHQFGNFVPQLGDGRAILLGEVIDRAGTRRDIVLKGAGRTRFSRGGDGRAAIGPVLREYIVAEAMHALGIPTTRALAAVATGETVIRETMLPGAVLTRIAASHVRVGTFQFFAARRDREGVETLADHVIERHYPEAKDAAIPALELLGLVCERQARLVAQWLLVGFIHGVMNTDNMAISGETIDYGPCAFLDAYDPETVLSSIDLHGRYAYGNQPSIALWDLTRFAETLLPLLDEDKDRSVALAEEALQRFAPAFERAYGEGLRRKLGLPVAGDGEADEALVRGFLNLMARHGVDFTLGFRRLGSAPGSVGWEALRGWMELDPAFDEWAGAWRGRLGLGESKAPSLDGVNPVYIPRNHLVEQALAAAAQDDLKPFEDLVAALADPFGERPGLERYALPARDEERVLRTFCGT